MVSNIVLSSRRLMYYLWLCISDCLQRWRFSPSFPHSLLKKIFLRQLFLTKVALNLWSPLFQLPSGDMWNAFDYRSWFGKEVVEDMTFEMVFGKIQELLLMWFMVLEMEPILGIILPLKCPPALKGCKGTGHEWAGRLIWLDDWYRTGCTETIFLSLPSRGWDRSSVPPHLTLIETF